MWSLAGISAIGLGFHLASGEVDVDSRLHYAGCHGDPTGAICKNEGLYGIIIHCCFYLHFCYRYFEKSTTISIEMTSVRVFHGRVNKNGCETYDCRTEFGSRNGAVGFLSVERPPVW